MDIRVVERINLLELLEDEHPDVPPPPEDAAELWTAAQIRGHYASANLALASSASSGSKGDAPASRPPPAPATAAAAALAALHPGAFSGSCREAATHSHSLKPDEILDAAAESHNNGLAAANPTADAGRTSPGSDGATLRPEAKGNGTVMNEDPAQPGGGRLQLLNAALDPANAPAALRSHQLGATVAGYRAAAIAHGIPFRRHGMFPPGDPLLAELSQLPGSHPFEKHMAGAAGSYQSLPGGGWTTGDASCRAGFDLRMFYQEAQPGAERGTLLAAARLGEAASIGAGCWVSAHGGAVESLLDEATAECAKMEWAPTLATLEAAFKIKKAVPLNTTLRISCEIASIRGVRCWVNGSITDPSGKVTYAMCEAQLIDLAQLWAG